jgi:hypothetical protein
MRIVSILRRIIGPLAIAAVLAGCSAVKLGYNNFAEVAYWWLDSYIEFSDEQAPRVRQDLARLHSWHRTQELPRLAEMLHRMEELAPADITDAQACAFVPRIRERLQATANQAQPALITLAMTLSTDQLRHLERKYERNNAEYRKKWIEPPPAEVADKRLHQFLERSESIYGSLDEPQRIVLRRQLEHSVFDGRKVLAERMRRQQDALRTLRRLSAEPLSFADAGALMRGYFARVDEPPDPAHRRYQRALMDEGCRAFASLHNSTTPAQRDAAVGRLLAYQRDLRELAAQQ